MLRSFCRWSRLRSFSTAQSLLPQIKDEAASSETESSRSESDTAEDVSIEGSASLLIGSKANIRKVAGKLASVVREQDESDPILLKATGINAVNAAVKCIHIARRYLIERPGIHIGFYVNHQKEADKDRISQLHFLIRRVEPLSRDPRGLEEMWVSRMDKGRTVGRMMTLAIQYAENAVALGIGPRSVGNMVVGLAWARRMLHARKMDVVAVPDMVHVSLKKADVTLSAIRMMLMRVPYERLDALDPDEPFDDNKEASFIEDPMSS